MLSCRFLNSVYDNLSLCTACLPASFDISSHLLRGTVAALPLSRLRGLLHCLSVCLSVSLDHLLFLSTILVCRLLNGLDCVPYFWLIDFLPRFSYAGMMAPRSLPFPMREQAVCFLRLDEHACRLHSPLLNAATLAFFSLRVLCTLFSLLSHPFLPSENNSAISPA